jgi:quinoprotein glucose dehydrogenase
VLAIADPARMVGEWERVVSDPAADLSERQASIDLVAMLEHPAATDLVGRLADRLTAGELDPAMALEVREAASRRLGRAVMPPTGQADDPLNAWADTVAGGDAARGREIFFGKVEVSCVRCHRAEGIGGEVGPRLDGIGSRKDVRYLLESIVSPDTQVAEGFQTTILITDEGRPISGIVVSEDDERLTLRSAEGELVVVPLSEIEERVAGPSSMPADLAGKLSRRELRDLMAWLVSLQADRSADSAAVLP